MLWHCEVVHHGKLPGCIVFTRARHKSSKFGLPEFYSAGAVAWRVVAYEKNKCYSKQIANHLSDGQTVRSVAASLYTRGLHRASDQRVRRGKLSHELPPNALISSFLRQALLLFSSLLCFGLSHCRFCTLALLLLSPFLCSLFLFCQAFKSHDHLCSSIRVSVSDCQ